MDLGCYVLSAARHFGRWIGARAGVAGRRGPGSGHPRWTAPSGRAGYAGGGPERPSGLGHGRLLTEHGVDGARDRGDGGLAVFAVPHLDPRLLVTDASGATREEIPEAETSYTHQLAALADPLDGGEPFLVDVDDAVANVELVDTVYRRIGLVSAARLRHASLCACPYIMTSGVSNFAVALRHEPHRASHVDVDRSSPVPLYHQLAEQLSAVIADETLRPGDPFENELALSERLQLSRPTVRRAIQELVDQGLLVRRRGLGTTVANRKVHRRIELSEPLRRPRSVTAASRGPTYSTFETVTDERAATALDLDPAIELLHVVRVRRASEEPLALLHNWLPPTSSRDLTREELESNGLYAALRDRGIKPVVAQQTIGARMPDAVERRRSRSRAAASRC